MARKPKKAFIQFAVASVVAVVGGALAIGLFFLVMTMIQGNFNAELEATKAQNEELLAEIDDLKDKIKKPVTVRKNTYVVATRTIEQGEKITKDMLKELETKDNVRGTKSKVSFVIGKVSSKTITEGEAIKDSHLLNTDGMLELKDGLRAVTINIDAVAGVGGAVMPGTYVDIMTTLEDPSTKGSRITKTILQNKRVISVGGQPGGMLTSATIEATPEEAEMLVLANTSGRFHLALRGFTDKEDYLVYGTDTAQLINGLPESGPQLPDPNVVPVNYTNGDLPEPAVPEPMSQSYSMEIFKGANSETVTFDVASY